MCEGSRWAGGHPQDCARSPLLPLCSRSQACPEQAHKSGSRLPQALNHCPWDTELSGGSSQQQAQVHRPGAGAGGLALAPPPLKAGSSPSPPDLSPASPRGPASICFGSRSTVLPLLSARDLLLHPPRLRAALPPPALKASPSDLGVLGRSADEAAVPWPCREPPPLPGLTFPVYKAETGTGPRGAARPEDLTPREKILRGG